MVPGSFDEDKSVVGKDSVKERGHKEGGSDYKDILGKIAGPKVIVFESP